MDYEEELKLFSYSHLPEHLQEVSRPFCELAHKLVESSRPGKQLEWALHYLCLAKDAAVRAAVVVA